MTEKKEPLKMNVDLRLLQALKPEEGLYEINSDIDEEEKGVFSTVPEED